MLHGAALWALWAHALALGPVTTHTGPHGGLTGQVRAGVQLLAGQSHSPFITGPDSAPLLNAGLTEQAQSTYNLLITPNGEIAWRARSQEYALSYGPRLFLDMRNLSNTPTAFHIISGRVLWGRPDRINVQLNPQLTIGGLDLGGGSAPSGTLFAGSTRPGTIGGIPSSYLSASFQGKIEIPWRRRMRFVSTELLALTRSPVNPSLPSTPQGLPTSGNFLFNMTRFDSLNEWVMPWGGGSVRWQLAPGWTNYPATRSYVTFLPAVAWQRGFGRGGTLNARVGAFVARQGLLPGRFTFTEVIAVVEAGVNHSLAVLGLPRLKGGVGVVLGPYWDPLFGLIQPRTTVTGNLGYDWTRALSTQLQLRYYTGRYVQFRLAPRHDRDVLISTLTVRYRLNAYMSAQLGGYTINRRRVPSRTDITSAANDYFLFLGLDGTLAL